MFMEKIFKHQILVLLDSTPYIYWSVLSYSFDKIYIIYILFSWLHILLTDRKKSWRNELGKYWIWTDQITAIWLAFIYKQVGDRIFEGLIFGFVNLSPVLMVGHFIYNKMKLLCTEIKTFFLKHLVFGINIFRFLFKSFIQWSPF